MPDLSVLLLALFYLPGFIAFKLYSYWLRSSRRYTAYETALYALLFATISLVPILFIKRFDFTTDVSTIAAAPVTIADFALFCVINLVLGAVLGAARKACEARFNSLRTQDCWTDFFSKLRGGTPVELKVITRDGLEYVGWFDFAGIRYDRREISLTRASKILRKPNGEYRTRTTPVTRLLFTDKDVSRIALMPNEQPP